MWETRLRGRQALATHHDLIVIGSGSGLEVSSEAADRGMSVAVIEDGPFGGTCLNRGCIPSKLLIHCADVVQTIRGAGRFGITASVDAIDWDFIMERTYREIDEDARTIEEGNRSHPNITVYKGTGRFVGMKTVEVNGEEVSAETVLIAAGTRPRVPEIPGLDATPYLTSDEALRLERRPDRMIIVGGGYIAAEMAHFYGAMGTDVTLVHRGQSLLRSEDEDVARRFTEVYQRRFTMHLESNPTRTYPLDDDGGVGMEISTPSGDQTLVADVLLLATGRVPNTDLLGVEATGVAVNGLGFVEVDDYLETNVGGIWALGDIVGRNLLKHSANLEAAYAANNMFEPASKVPVDYHAMPRAIFASPQVGAVGVTERMAVDRGIPHVTATYAYRDTAYGQSIDDQDGFVKVIASPDRGEILGCHIVGTDASILIQEATNAMRSRLTVDAITQSIYVHPALPEVVQRAFGALPN
jgi:dihydrolipoamide dehydrogenase